MSSLKTLVGVDKFWRFLYIIKVNGGPFKSLHKFWRFDTLKEGKLMGEDEFGNKYYENQYYMIGSSRWVEHADFFRWDYDASQVTPQWFSWLHYRTDKLPSDEASTRVRHPWMTSCHENLTGTVKTYMPWSTTKPRIIPWDGRSQASRDDKQFQAHKPFDALK